MKLLLTTLLLSSFIRASAQPDRLGFVALYGCFHNGSIYSITKDIQLCPSFSPHTHDSISANQNNIVTKHYNATGMIGLTPNNSIMISPSFITVSPVKNHKVGDPDCILSKVPISQ